MPINLKDIPKEDPNLWETLNAPRIDIRSHPTMQHLTDAIADKHPYLAAYGDALMDTVSSFTSPISAALALLSGGSGMAGKAGLTKLASGLAVPGKAAAVGMVGHGGYKGIQGLSEADYPKAASGAGEAMLGMLGLRGGPKPPTGGPDYSTPSGLRVALKELKNNPNPVQPGTPEYANFKAMHQALDANTLANKKGPIAVNDIYGQEGRPDISVKDEVPGSKLPRVSKGLSITDAEKAHEEGLNLVAKDVKSANALEKAKGASPKIVQQELEAKKPLLDLIEASKTRRLTQDEINSVRQEATQYPKGVVATALNDLRKNTVAAGRAQDQAVKMNNSDAAANLDVRMGREQAINEGFKANADANKGVAKAESTAAKAEVRENKQSAGEVKRDQDWLARTQKWAEKRQADKIAQANAEAQQGKIDEYLNRENIESSTGGVRQTTRGTSDIGEPQSQTTTFREKPPEEEGPGASGPPSPPPAPIPPTDRVFKSRGEAADAARLAKLGSDKWNIYGNRQDGFRIVSKPTLEALPEAPGSTNPMAGGPPPPEPGGATPGGAVMPPSLERDKLATKTFNNRAEANALAKYSGGTVRNVGPRKYRRKYRIEFPPELTPEVSDYTGGQPEHTVEPPVPGGTPPGSMPPSSAPPEEPPAPAPTGTPPPKPLTPTGTESPVSGIAPGSQFDRMGLTPEEFQRYNDIKPIMGVPRTAAERAEYDVLNHKRLSPPEPLPSEDAGLDMIGKAIDDINGQGPEPPAPTMQSIADLTSQNPRPVAGMPFGQGKIPSGSMEGSPLFGESNPQAELFQEGNQPAPEPPPEAPTAPQNVDQGTGGAFPFQISRTPTDLAGEFYGQVKAAKKAGLPVAEVDRANAGRTAQRLAKESKPPTTQVEAVQRDLNDPNIDPLTKTMLQRWLDKLMKEEGGFAMISRPSGEGIENLRKIGSFLNETRRSTLLNPLSVAKKGVGDIQGLTTAAILNPSKAGDILSSLFHPETIEGFKAGWHAPTQGMEAESGLENLFRNPKNPLTWSGRAMAGLTNATKGVFDRAGFTPEEGQAYTMTKTPSRAGTAPLYELFNKPGFNYLNPFTRIALNWLEQGYEHSPLGMMDLITKADQLSGPERMMVLKKAALGTVAGGAAYAATPDDFVKKHPALARVATAGPVGLPILFGMALKNKKNSPFFSAVSDLTEEIPGMRLAEELRDPRAFARNHLAGFTNVTKPIAEAIEMARSYPAAPPEPDLYSRNLTDTQKLVNKALANIPVVRQSLPSKGQEFVYSPDMFEQ